MATDNRGLNARQAILQGSTFVLSMYICSKLGICTFYPCPASSPKPLGEIHKKNINRMRIVNLQIKNYKSIDDSKICFLEKDMTIFAGKNESGKSSILEALYDFNYGENINPDSIQINNEDAQPEIILNLEMEVDEQNKYFSFIGIEKKVVKEFSFKLTKTNQDEYIFEDEAEVHFELKSDTVNTKVDLMNKIESSFKVLEELYELHLSSEIGTFIEFDSNNINFKEILEEIKYYKKEITEIDIDEILSSELKEMNQSNLILFEESLYSLYKLPKDNINLRKDKLLNMLPNFILFKSFEDDIPNKVAFDELQKNEFIKDLEVISNFNKSILISGNDRKQSDHKEKINIEFNKEYKEFWTQDDTSFEFDWHDRNLLIWIKENGGRYKPTERSKGKQWHLAFYIRVTARAIENKDNIILIDEPGMYLHAKAQSDIYSKLLKISKNAQVIFTTHSPYLLKYDEIDRIRLVKKVNSKSWINQKVHIGSDKETLTPLLTAIGLELNTEIHSMDKMNNVVVEGPSDFYYLQAIKILRGINDFNFIFGGGATKMAFVGTILTGWGTNVVYLFDNDSGKKLGEKTLKNDWKISDEEIESVIDTKGAIEDIWSCDFFKEEILLNKEPKYQESNSDYIKKHSIDKVLLAKVFLAKVRNSKTKLDSETKTNLDNLIKKIRKHFKL